MLKYAQEPEDFAYLILSVCHCAILAHGLDGFISFCGDPVEVGADTARNQAGWVPHLSIAQQLISHLLGASRCSL